MSESLKQTFEEASLGGEIDPKLSVGNEPTDDQLRRIMEQHGPAVIGTELVKDNPEVLKLIGSTVVPGHQEKGRIVGFQQEAIADGVNPDNEAGQGILALVTWNEQINSEGVDSFKAFHVEDLIASNKEAKQADKLREIGAELGKLATEDFAALGFEENNTSEVEDAEDVSEKVSQETNEDDASDNLKEILKESGLPEVVQSYGDLQGAIQRGAKVELEAIDSAIKQLNGLLHSTANYNPRSRAGGRLGEDRHLARQAQELSEALQTTAGQMRKVGELNVVELGRFEEGFSEAAEKSDQSLQEEDDPKSQQAIQVFRDTGEFLGRTVSKSRRNSENGVAVMTKIARLTEDIASDRRLTIDDVEVQLRRIESQLKGEFEQSRQNINTYRELDEYITKLASML